MFISDFQLPASGAASSQTTSDGNSTTATVAASSSPLGQSSLEISPQQQAVKDALIASRFSPDADPFGVKDIVTVQDLLEARVHFGHEPGKWSRRIKPYLYGIRGGLHIFNLNTTLANLQRALHVTGLVAYQNGVILFVNERRQFEALTMKAAVKCGEYYVTNWVPGTLTNSYKLLKTLRVPDLMLFFSVPRSKTVVKEAVTYGVPSVGVVDSDCNPNFILYPIPGNDDSLQSINLYCDLFCEVILRAKQLRTEDERVWERAGKTVTEESGETPPEGLQQTEQEQ